MKVEVSNAGLTGKCAADVLLLSHMTNEEKLIQFPFFLRLHKAVGFLEEFPYRAMFPGLERYCVNMYHLIAFVYCSLIIRSTAKGVREKSRHTLPDCCTMIYSLSSMR